MKNFLLTTFIIVSLLACDGGGKKNQIPTFIMNLAVDYIEENQNFFSSKGEKLFIQLKEDECHYIIKTFINEDDETFNKLIKDGVIKFQISNHEIFIIGDSIQCILGEHSFEKLFPDTNVEINTINDFEIPIWEIWLYKDYSLDELRTYKMNWENSIDNIRNLMVYLDCNNSIKLDSSCIYRPFYNLEYPPVYIAGQDSLRMRISEFDLSISNTLSQTGVYSCLIDTSGNVVSCKVIKSIGKTPVDSMLVANLNQLSGFSVPMNRGKKVVAYYHVPINVAVVD